MEIIIKPDAKSGCVLFAKIIADLVKNKPNAVLGLATGDTMEPIYAELVRMHQEEGLDFSRVTSFNLDEYVGLGRSHNQSYRYYMEKHLFCNVNISTDRIHVPNGLATDIPAACQRYEEEIKAAGGIDLQLLGIGRIGHIGFNEPTSSLASRTRIKTLTEATIRDNAPHFENEKEVPIRVLTMGIGTILEARCCLILAFGVKKADAVASMVEGPITSMVTASALQLHPKTIVVLDEDAASKLQLRDYYRHVYNNKPAWQRYE